jgi:hypothetical protein
MVHKLRCSQLLDNVKQVDFIMQLGLTFLVKFFFNGPPRHATAAATTAEPPQAVEWTVEKVLSLFQVFKQYLFA